MDGSPQSVLLTRVRLENVRGFRDVEVPLAPEAGQGVPLTTLVIGKNSTNKSTLLRAIALCLADPTEAAALLSHPIGSIVRSGERRATIELDVVNGSGDRALTLRRQVAANGDKDVVLPSGAAGDLPIFVCGYGAGRGAFGSDPGREYRVDDACASLYDYQRELIDPELTLRRLDDFLGSERYERTLAGIKRVLDLGPDDRIELLPGGGVQLTGPAAGGSVPLNGWADGYRLTVLWLLDLYGRAMRADRIDAEGRVHGVVLVDEVDQHLHPSLQATILPRLAELLPDVQMVATTHSPLVALGAEPSQLVVLRRVGDEIAVEHQVPDYRGYSAEDMLVDDRLFDSTVYAPDTQEQLARYEQLAAKSPSRRTAAEKRELAALARSMLAQPLPPGVDDRVAAALSMIGRRLPPS
jgi:hypothetical protein